MNLEKYSFEELIELNSKILKRLKYLEKQRINKFEFGDYVSFQDENGNTIKGHVKTLNKKTITIICENKHSWRVSPRLLTKIPLGVLATPPQH